MHKVRIIVNSLQFVFYLSQQIFFVTQSFVRPSEQKLKRACFQFRGRDSMNKSSIREANEHLQKLHSRIYELESKLQLQAMHIEELQRKNTELTQQLRQEREEHDSVAAAKEDESSRAISRLETQLQQLLESAEERDAAMIKLEAKSRLFYEVAEHKYALSRILELLEEVSDMKSRDSHPSQNQDSVVSAPALPNGQQDNSSSKTAEYDTYTASNSTSCSDSLDDP